MKAAGVTRLLPPALAALALSACGYHVQGQPVVIPKDVHTIAVVPFQNNTTRFKLARLLSDNIAQEMIARTKYKIVSDPNQADVVLRGVLLTFTSYGIASDPSGHATGAQAIITLQITLTERATGKVLYSRPPSDFRERYEVSSDPQQYFDESGTAIERLGRDVARDAVAGILSAF
jgi:hypothetical protein